MSDDPHQTLGEGRIRHYPSMLSVANAFAQAREPFKQVIYDDGYEVRDLNRREERMLAAVCDKLGLDIEDVDG